VDAPRQPAVLTLPFARARARAWLHEAGVVTAETEGEGGWTVAVSWTDRQAEAFAVLPAGA
jgi:GTP-binding protein HflX